MKPRVAGEQSAAALAMKVKPVKRPKVRRTWAIKPVTRVQESEKKYSRARARRHWRQRLNDE